MTRILGPYITHHEGAIAAPSVTVPGKIGVQFDPVTPIVMGGTANLQLLAPVLATDELPSLIEVAYVPIAQWPNPPTLAALDALAGLSSANYSVPSPPPAALTTFPVVVAPPPANGKYMVATAITYPT